jgi:hypothetical protein
VARESSHRELQLSYSPLTALSRWTKVDPLNSARALNMASGAPGLAPGTLNVTRDTPTNDWAVSCVCRVNKRCHPPAVCGRPPQLQSELAAAVKFTQAREVSCDEASHARVLFLAQLLSRDLQRSHPAYTTHGLMGIFADGAPINRYANGTARVHLVRSAHRSLGLVNRLRANYLDYKHLKTRFLHQRTCERAAWLSQGTKRLIQVCEIGFNAGLSSLLLLEASASRRMGRAVSGARVRSFDIDAFPYTRTASALLTLAYAERLDVSFGDADALLAPSMNVSGRHTQQAACDITFVDGQKSVVGKLGHLKVLAKHSAQAGAWIFVDDVKNGSWCGRRTVEPDGHTLCIGTRGTIVSKAAAASEGLAAAVQLGIVHLIECRWPSVRPHDGWKMDGEGLCLAEVSQEVRSLLRSL